jgi:hypothetical protein
LHGDNGARGAVGPARSRRSSPSRRSGAHPAGARGVLADQRRLAGHPSPCPERRRCPAAGCGDTILVRFVSCGGRVEPGDLRGAHRVERQGGGRPPRGPREGRLEEQAGGERRRSERVALCASRSGGSRRPPAVKIFLPGRCWFRGSFAPSTPGDTPPAMMFRWSVPPARMIPRAIYAVARSGTKETVVYRSRYERRLRR